MLALIFNSFVYKIATHIVRFWKLQKLADGQIKTSFPNTFINNEDSDYEWSNFKRLELNSRAVQIKFDNKYILTTTYSLTIEIYCVNTGRFLQQLVGHTCHITCYDFCQDLNLIVSGSADFTVKFWSFQTESDDLHENSDSCLVTSEFDKIWPIRILIEKCPASGTFLVITLSTHGFIYVKSVEKINDVIPVISETTSDSSFKIFDFKKSKLLFGAKFDLKLNAQYFFSDNINEDASILLLCNRSFLKYSNKTLVAYLVTDSNASQNTKVYIRKWHLDEDNSTFNLTEVNDTSYEFLNRKSQLQFGIKRYEIIAFGLW